jgi:hypothetical protein
MRLTLARRLRTAVRLAAVATATAIVACDSTGPHRPVSSTSIIGLWSEVPAAGAPPGSFMEVGLGLNGTAIIGHGSWAGEAGPFGPVTATGTVVSDSVVLDLTFDYDPRFAGAASRHAQFGGRMITGSSLVGTLVADGVSSPIEFRKQVLFELPH